MILRIVCNYHVVLFVVTHVIENLLYTFYSKKICLYRDFTFFSIQFLFTQCGLSLNHLLNPVWPSSILLTLHKFKVWMTIVESRWNVWVWLVGVASRRWVESMGVVNRRWVTCTLSRILNTTIADFQSNKCTTSAIYVGTA